MNNASFSNCRDEDNRSDKDCVCGGHNASNPKRNLNHHGTQVKLNRRILRRFKEKSDET